MVLKEFEADLEGVKKGLPGYDVPVEDKSSWLSRILRGADRKAPSVEVVGFHFPRRALRLDRHPMLMGLEEVAAMKGIMEDAKKIPTTDIMGGTMAWEDTGSLVAWARRNKSNLRALNIDRVTFRRADGKRASLTLDGDYGGALLPQQIRDRFGELERGEPKVVDAEGKTVRESPTEVKLREDAKAFVERVVEDAGGGPEAYFMGLLERTKRYGGQEFDRQKAQGLRDEWVSIRRALSEEAPNSSAYVKAMRDQRELLQYLEQATDLAKAVYEGGLDAIGPASAGVEMKALNRFDPETPYLYMGGQNLDGMSSAMSMRNTVILIRRLEEEVGADGVTLFQRGHFDADLYDIKHWLERKLGMQEGKKGTASEDGKEALRVSPTAWKIYRVLEESSLNSQRSLAYSGFSRPVRPGYIGPLTYGREAIVAAGVEDFTKALREATVNVDEGRAREIFAEVAAVRTEAPDGADTLGNMHEFMQRFRQFEFKSGRDEYGFNRRFGSQGDLSGSRNRLQRALGIGRSSAILTNHLAGLETDANMAATMRTYGSRPFLTLDLLASTMRKKAEDKLGRGEVAGLLKYAGGDKARLEADTQIRKAVSGTKQMLVDYLFGKPVAVSPAATFLDKVRMWRNTAVLPYAAITAGVGDLHLGVNHLAKFSRENPEAFFPVTELARQFVERLRHVPLRKRQAIARMMHLQLSSDFENFKARMSESAGTGIVPFFENLSMRAFGIPWMTDVGRSSHAMATAAGMGENLGYAWRDVGDRLRRELMAHGIGEWEWEFVRGIGAVVDVEGVPMLYAERLRNKLIEAEMRGKLYRGNAENLFHRFETFMADFVRIKTSPQPGGWELQMMRSGRNPDNLSAMAWKLFSQFAAIAAISSRSALDARSPRLAGKRVGMFHRGMGAVMASGLVLGGAGVFLKSFAKGKWRNPFEDQEAYQAFLFDSMVQSGILGIWGDYVLSESSQTRAGFLSRLAGPVISGPGYGAMATVTALAGLRGEDVLKHANYTFWQMFPGISFGAGFIGNTMFLDSLGRMSGDKQSRAAVRRRMDEIGESFIVD